MSQNVKTSIPPVIHFNFTHLLCSKINIGTAVWEGFVVE
jgi:hypothetical protein